MVPLGVSDGRIAKENMKADSTFFDKPGSSFTGASEARLNNRPSENGEGAWVPKYGESCLYITFNKVEALKEMKTQGHPSKSSFARRYSIQYKVKEIQDWETMIVVGIRYTHTLTFLSILTGFFKVS